MARQVTEDELEKEYRRYKADLGAAGNPNVVDQTTYVKQRDYTVVPRPKRPDVDFSQINAGLELERQRNNVYRQYGGVGLGAYDLAQGAAEGTRKIGRGLKGAYDFTLGPWVREGKNAVGGLAYAVGIGDDAGNANTQPPSAQTPKPSVEEARREAIQQGRLIPSDLKAPPPAAQEATAPAAAPQSQSNVRSWGEPGQPGSGTARFSGTLPAPGSNFRNYGYDPAEARAYQQVAPNTYQGGGYTFQGSGADAARFFQPVAPSAHTPQANNSTFLKYRQQELAEEAARRAQSQMPEPPIGGWQTARAVYERQMDAFNREQDRQHALELARVGNAQQAERLGLDRQRLGFDQEQARQAMNLQRAQLGLQADQNVWNRAKAMSDMEQAAVGRQLQQIQLGAQQDYLRAVQSGDAAAIARAEAALQALNPKGRGGRAAKDAGGMKVHEIDFGDGRKLSGVINQDGSFSPVMPVEINWLYQNWNNLTAEQQRTAENMNPLQLYSFASSLYAKAQAARAADEEAKKKK